MPNSLKRLLRLRALREEASRMEVESEAARLREIDLAAAAAAREANASRKQAFAEAQGGWTPGAAEEAGFPAPSGEAAADRAASAKGEAGRREDPADRPNEAWRRAEAAWESAFGRQGACEQRRPAQQARVERAQGRLLADRRDRLQAETLVEAAAALERVERARLDQRGLDDWFQSWARRARRESETEERGPR